MARLTDAIVCCCDVERVCIGSGHCWTLYARPDLLDALEAQTDNMVW